MTRIPMLDNILSQPASHHGVLALHASDQGARLSACAELVRKATGRVIFTGMGGSLFAVPPAVVQLSEQGYAVEAVESAELLHYGSASLRAGDVGVVVSRSGGSIEPVLLAEKMRRADMRVIAVTNVPGSRLEELADVTLPIGAQADNLIAVQTYTGTVLTLLLLATEVLSAGSAKLADACNAALPALSEHIEACLQASETWEELLMGAPLYLLGRGPALGAVHEGALLMHETAKVAAVGMSSGQFRHGPAEILSGNFRAVVIGTPAATRALDRALANDIRSSGAMVYWIGPDKDAQDNRDQVAALVPWPQIPSVLAPLFDIVPLQVAAYRLALWRGVRPGDFRFVTEVTASESGFPGGR